MGRKNKSNKPGEPKDGKDTSQQPGSSTSQQEKGNEQNPQQRPQGGSNHDQKGAKGQEQRAPQQGVPDQQSGPEQAKSQQKSDGQQQHGRGQQQRPQGGQDQRGPWGQEQRGPQQGVPGKQRGPEQARGQQKIDGQQQHGRGQQQRPQGGQDQRGPWGQEQRGPQQGVTGQQRGPEQARGQQKIDGQQQHGRGQQQRPQGGQDQRGPWRQEQRGPQQGVPDQHRRPEQGRDRQQSDGQQQHGRGQQQRPQGGQDQRGPWGQEQRGPQQGVPGQQRGPEQAKSQQKSDGQQQHGMSQQQRPQGGQDQRGPWGQEQRGPQQGVPDQQRRPEQGRDRQQSDGQQQHGMSQQQKPRGGQDQKGAWGQEQRGPQQGVPGQQRRPEQGRDRQQSDGQQQHGMSQQQRPQGGQDQRGPWGQEQRGPQQGVPGQQQHGRGQQQRPQGGNNQDQQMRDRNQPQQPTVNESPLPVKDKSCNGIVRGTLGTPGTVEVNYLRLNLDKMPSEAYHYDVAITPDRPKKFLRPAFEQFCRQVYPNIVLTFDGFKNCYSMERLKAPIEETIQVADSGSKMKEFKVKVQETDNCVVDLKALRNYQTERVFDKPMRALQVLEVVLASSNHERGIRVGRSFFRRPMNAFYLEDGYEAWTGLYQAAILGEMPLLNVDIAHKSFPCESTLIEYLDNMRVDKSSDLQNNNYLFRDISSFLNGVNVIYTPPPCFNAVPKQYKVMGIGEPASKKTFKTDDGKSTTVLNYFRSKGYNLQYPNLNCLTVGSTIRQISIPMELCSIPGGQALNRKDQSRQVEKMIRYAATSTNMRKQKIMDLLTYFNHNVNPIIRSFGLSIGNSFLKVPTRLLPSPTLEYLQGRTVGTFKGAWRMDENKFLICSKPPNGHRWAILYEESRGGRGVSYHDLEDFKSLVIKTSQSLNMNLQNTAEIASYRVQQLQGMLKDFATQNFDLVFVVLSERGTAYAKIKQIAELDVGILTQCIKDKTVFRTKKDRTVFSNILLKVNGKLNGTNHKIGQDRNSNLLSPVKNVMYLGADVTHPSPDQRHIPSVVGVAASHDSNGACYNCQYRLQRSTVENIEDMESIASRHLEKYYQYQKKFPDQIIYYRDGVSDGQFPIVEREEIRAIKKACAQKRCNPKLTCIIVVKRHHTRFFPLTKPQHDRDFNNVQAGTVVDQYITHPNEIQFFMVSHQSIQGTARPTRYNVIMDESKFDINLLQKLTYNLCHLFPRCNRAVSYPAPAYLAHLVAFRGRVYLEGTQRFDTNLKREYDRRQIKPQFMEKNPMYFI